VVRERVDALLIDAHAAVIQSRDGSVVLLAFRGTPPMGAISWLVDLDTSPQNVVLGAVQDGAGTDAGAQVHGGFYRNVRSIRYAVLDALLQALEGRSVVPGEPDVEHPMQHLYVTGHSLGGAMAQLYMGSHPDTGGILHVSDTFGSPGALQTAAPDARITDFVIADDPAVFAGLHRGEIGDVVRSNPLIADALAPAIANDFPGLTAQDVRNSVPSFTANYVNRGETVLLPGASGSTTPLDRNADLAKALIGADPAEHHSDLYVAKVAAAASVDAGAPGTVLTPFTPGRAPEPLFSSSFYLANNKDVAASGIDPQQHYDQYGWHEGRNPDAVFNTRYYLAHNPDVAAAGINPLQHYETNGWHEGRNPDPIFDVTYYLSHNPDVAAAGIDPLLHYEQYGWKEGRDPSASFSTSSYLAHNPDVAAAGVNPLEHYLNTGIEEHRLL
jgi:hypothetical protein